MNNTTYRTHAILVSNALIESRKDTRLLSCVHQSFEDFLLHPSLETQCLLCLVIPILLFSVPVNKHRYNSNFDGYFLQDFLLVSLR